MTKVDKVNTYRIIIEYDAERKLDIDKVIPKLLDLDELEIWNLHAEQTEIDTRPKPAPVPCWVIGCPNEGERIVDISLSDGTEEHDVNLCSEHYKEGSGTAIKKEEIK